MSSAHLYISGIERVLQLRCRQVRQIPDLRPVTKTSTKQRRTPEYPRKNTAITAQTDCGEPTASSPNAAIQAPQLPAENITNLSLNSAADESTP